MKTKFTYYHVLEYLPTRYSASSSQKNDRSAVYQFKDGYCEPRIFDGLVEGVNHLAGYNKSDYVICFIPASTQHKTNIRYRNLATRLENATGVKARFNAISRTVDKASGYLNGKSGNPTEGLSFDASYFRGKRVILIDDVVTRGRTFCLTANELLNRGAIDVEGLFVAKTVNPDWNRACA